MSDSLDLLNPPKYCPQCLEAGGKSKVKKFRMKNGNLVLMCKNSECPWPFSRYTKEEVTIKVDACDDAAVKKRKKNKTREVVISPSLSPDGKKQRVETLEDLDRLGDPDRPQQDVVPEDEAGKQTPAAKSSDATETKEASVAAKANNKTICPSSQETTKQPPPPLDDSDVFSRLPVAVRQPLRLPRHAAHILDSRINPSSQDAVDASAEILDQDLSEDDGDVEEVQALDGSDSELESLVSECSTMSTFSESSLSDVKGAGKIKKRGKKKNRKDRRKQHTGKCSKQGKRCTDISAVFTETKSGDQRAVFTETKDGDQPAVFTETKDGDHPALSPPSVAQPSTYSPSPDLTPPRQLSPMLVDPEPIIISENALPDKARPLSPSQDNLPQLLYKDEDLELNIILADPNWDRIGSGDRCVQFSFCDIFSGETAAFPPVFIVEYEVEHLTNVLTQLANKYKEKFYSQKPTRDDERVDISRSVLERNVVKHLEKCFTKTSMKKHRVAQAGTGQVVGENKARRRGRKPKINNQDVDEATEGYMHVEPNNDPSARVNEEIQPELLAANNRSRKESSPHKSDAKPEEPESLFKVPLGPVRVYPSPRGAAAMSPAHKRSPRSGIPFSQSGVAPGASPKYCAILSEPLSPMPATPRSVHDLPDPEDHLPSDPIDSDEEASKTGYPPATDTNLAEGGDSNLELGSTPSVADTADTERGPPDIAKDGDISLPLGNVSRRQGSIPMETKTDAKPGIEVKSLSNRLMMGTGIDIRATIVPEESNVAVPTLALFNFADEDDEYSKICKIGTGSASAQPVFEEVATEPAKSSCVFHVANDISIDMPLEPRNLEISERGSNKIYLTADSDQIEAHSMRTKQVYTNPTISRAKKKKPQKANFGRGWFTWKDWKVDKDLMTNYTAYLSDLAKKWDSSPVSALSEERRENPNDYHVIDIIDFFLQVFVKVYHLKNVYSLDIDDCIDFVRSKYTLDKDSFNKVCQEVLQGGLFKASNVPLDRVLSKETIQRLDNPLPPPSDKFILPLPEQVAHEMASVVQAKATIKTEPVDYENIPSVRVDHHEPHHRPGVVKTEPGIPSGNVPNNHGTSVAVVDPGQQQDVEQRVGTGSKCLQFFFVNPLDGSKISFKPVYVEDDDDVNYVVALVNEKAGDYKYKLGLISKPTMYYAEAVRARSKLEPAVVRYIEQCFTKRGMREHRPDYKKRSYPKRCPKPINKIVKSEMTGCSVDKNLGNPGDAVVSVEEFEVTKKPPRKGDKANLRTASLLNIGEDQFKKTLEERVFGGRLPTVKISEGSFMQKTKAKNARGGPREETILEAVEILLDPHEKASSQKRHSSNLLKLSNMTKKKAQRPRQRRSSSSSSNNSSDEDDFYANMDNWFKGKDNANVRTSARLRAKHSQVECDTEEKLRNAVEVTSAADGVGEANAEACKLAASPNRKVTFSDETLRDMTRALTREEDRPVSQDDIRPGSYSGSRPDSQAGSRPGSQHSRPASQAGSRPGSQAASRPGSQAGSRPDSQAGSRPVSRNRKQFGVSLESISEPVCDSPVLTPRRRQLEKLPRALTPKSPVGVRPIPEKTVQIVTTSGTASGSKLLQVGESYSSLPLATTLNNFDKMSVRKNKKVQKVLEKQKRKAERYEKKKLLGFGQKKDVPDEKVKEKARPHVKKAQVTKEESDLLASLLQDAEKAVLESKESVGSKRDNIVEAPRKEVRDTNLIANFEEAASLEGTPITQLDELLSTL